MSTSKVNPYALFDADLKKIIDAVDAGGYQPDNNQPARDVDTAVITLRSHRVLNVLNDHDRSLLVGAGQLLTFKTDQVISRQGTSVECVVFILEGRARAEISSRGGAALKAVVNVLGPADDIGLLSVVDGAPHPANVTALGDIKALSIPMSVVRAHLGSREECYRPLAEMAVERLRTSDLWIQACL